MECFSVQGRRVNIFIVMRSHLNHITDCETVRRSAEYLYYCLDICTPGLPGFNNVAAAPRDQREIRRGKIWPLALSQIWAVFAGKGEVRGIKSWMSTINNHSAESRHLIHLLTLTPDINIIHSFLSVFLFSGKKKISLLRVSSLRIGDTSSLY